VTKEDPLLHKGMDGIGPSPMLLLATFPQITFQVGLGSQGTKDPPKRSWRSSSNR